MRRTALRLMLAIAALCGTQAPAAGDLQALPTPISLDQTAALRASQAVLGNRIGDFTLLDPEGRPVRLSQYRGKPLLVSFIYTGCFQPMMARARTRIPRRCCVTRPLSGKGTLGCRRTCH